MGKLAALMMFSVMALTGCVSLMPSLKPLEERVLEGEGGPKILLVDLDGVISFREESDRLRLSKRPSMVAVFRETFLKAEADPDIAGVIVRINSPGGTVAASDSIYHEIVNFRQKRKIPVYAFIMEVGASGGYYVASASDRIVASPTAVTGSIGVIAMKFNVEGLFAKIGVSEETFKSGPKKDFWSPFRPTTPEEKKMFQDIIDGLHSRFIAVVAANRQKVLTEEEVRMLADGRVLSAGDALGARLVDGVAYLDETVEAMKKQLGIDKARVVTYDRPKTFKSTIYSEYSDGQFPGPQVINLLSINADDIPFSSGIRFMYLWSL